LGAGDLETGAPPAILSLPPNRVRRNYRGGMLLDTWQGATHPIDSDAPEDWMASTTLAMNPGMPEVLNEGLASASLPGGEPVFLRDLFRVHGDFYLGPEHLKRHGTQLGFLAKLLDSSMRLHIQAHPTAAFAQKHLDSKWGKFETYLILGCREGIEPSILLGFQRPPTPAEWRRIIVEQDLAAMAACFDPIPVKTGQVWMVPGGLPHALGEGLLVLEVMEPTDWVVRCEHTRGGIEVPPAARYMGRDPDLALQIFDYAPMSADEVARKYRVEPVMEHQTSGYSCEQLIGPAHTGTFETRRYTIRSKAVTGPLSPARLGLWVVLEGSGRVQSGGMELALHRGVKFISAAQTPLLEFTSTGETPLLLVCCSPGSGEGQARI
jgi:mannose-6-phosphate isomerase